MIAVGSVTPLPPAPITSPVETPPAADLDDAPVDGLAAAPEPAKKQPGVIRNLLEGHFKGVASLRLRINFADQLGAIQAAAVAELADAFLGDLSATEGTVTSSTDAFDQELADLRAGLDSALAAVEPEAPPAVLDGDLAVDIDPVPDEVQAPPAEPSTLLADALAAVDYLEEQLAAAVESVVSAQPVLPPVTEPSGNGVA